VKNEQEKQKILEIIQEYNNGPSSLIQVLNMIQDEHGYLPQNVQKLVAEEMGIPFSRVYEVTSFYSRFTTEEKGECTINVCLGTACYVKGAQKNLDELKSRLGIEEGHTTEDKAFTLTSSRCIGACALAPAIVVNKEVHGMVNLEKLAHILEIYE